MLSNDARDPMNGCAPAVIFEQDTRAIQNLKFTFIDPMGVVQPGGDNEGVGGSEERTFQFTDAETGTWMVRVAGDATDRVQRYTLQGFVSVTDFPLLTDEFGRILRDEDRLAVDVWTNMGIRGDFAQDFSAFDPPLQRSVVGVVEILQPNMNHVTLAGRPEATSLWTGVNPAATEVGQHATAVAAIAVGQDFVMPRPGTLEQIDFMGVATEAELGVGSVARVIRSDGSGIAGIEATYYALFGMTDPLIATQNFGLSGPVTVINSSIGELSGGGLGLTGDGDYSLAYDAVVYMRQVTVVLAAGDSGRIDETAACNGSGNPMDPGAAFVGSRTVGNPATCFNAIVVGSVASQRALQDGSMVMNDDNADGFRDEMLLIPTKIGRAHV